LSSEDIPALSLFAYYMAMLMDVDDLGDRLGEHLVTDPLTGLHNRKQFDHKLRQELLRARRYTLSVSLVVMDIDNLEDYNAACGHMLGNLALSDIASILLKGTREIDFVSRIGGDEFGLILPETNRLGALRLTDRLRSEVAAYPFPAPENSASVNLTVSAGIANFPASTGSDEELLAKAFRALELAKKEGPDSIKLWEEKLENAK
jgi:diguanylate cyclase (GGDEF)-like protein